MNDKENKDLQNAAIEMARMTNYRKHAEQLFVPILKDFQVKNDNNPQTILLASGDGFMEQLTSDGYIDDGQFEQRIDLVIKNTQEFMKKIIVKILITVLSIIKIIITEYLILKYIFKI